MSSIDERVVQMKFENDKFKAKAMETKQALTDVNAAMDKSGKSKGLLDLNSNMQKVGVTASKMAVVTTTALATIANKVTNVGLNLASALTFDPIRQGFSEYESLLTKQNVIMNATGKSAGAVKSILKELNDYSDQTIYSFGNMTDAVTKFVNAGVPLDKAVRSIRGIANAAAFAGASSEEANRAMYAFSQSMSLGFIGLQDWMQIENANLGTIKFKNSLLNAAVAAGTLTRKGNEFVTSSGKTISATKGWRDGLQDQWATTEVLNKTLGKYQLTQRQATKLMKEYGETNVIAALNTKKAAGETLSLAEKATLAATEVRTFTAFMDTLKESLGSGWAAIFTALFGGLEESTAMWTGFSNAIANVVSDLFHFGETTLTTWRKMGGFEKTLEGFSNLMAPFGAILKTVGKAWREVFPSSGSGSGKALYGISAGFAAITAPLQLLADLIEGSTPVLKTFFQIIKIGGVAIREGVGYIKDLVTGILGLAEFDVPSGGILQFAKDVAEAIADAVDEISDLLSKGKSLREAFGSVDLKLPSLPSLPSMPKIGNIFGGGDDKEVSKVARLTVATKGLTKEVFGLKVQSSQLQKTTALSKFSDDAKKGFDKAGNAASEFGSDMLASGDEIEATSDKMGGIFGKLKDVFLDFVEGFSFTTLVKSFNMALLATFTISIARLFNTFTKGFSGFAQLGGTFNDVLGQVGDSVKTFAKAQQRQATAKLILNLAIAIGILAVSLWILSKIPVEDLAKGFVFMAGTFLLMDQGMKSLTKLFDAMNGNGLSAAGNMLVISVAIISLGVAMLLLAGAMLILNYVKWSSILKGLGVMIVMTKVLERLSSTVDGIKWAALLAAGFALIALAGAMTIMAGALMLFALVKWESIGKAGAVLGGVTLALGALVALTKSKYGAAALAAAGAGFVLVAGGMVALANALILFAFVKWSSIGKAGVALGGLAVAMTAMVAGSISGPGLLLATVGLNALATALILFEKVNWSSILKMPIAMFALAAGLVVLTPILYLAAPALILFGIAIASIGVGILAFMTAMSLAVVIAGTAAVTFSAIAIALVAAIAIFLQALAAQAPIMQESILSIIQTIIDTFVLATPMVIKGVKDLWAAIKKELGIPEKKKDAEDASKSWVQKIYEGIDSKIPTITRLAAHLVVKFIEGLVPEARGFGRATTALIAEFVQGIADRSDSIIASGTALIVTWIQGMGRAAGRISNAALTAAVLFLNSLATQLENKSGPIGSALSRCVEAMVGLGADMVGGFASGLVKGVIKHSPASILGGVVSGAINKAKEVADSHSPSRKMIELGMFMAQGLSIGIQNGASLAIQAVANMVTGQIATASKYINAYIQKVDQQAIAARAQADGLALAAERAQKQANKTKSKKDDVAADRLSKQAKAAQANADRAEARSEAAQTAAERAEEYREASTIDKAKMRSEDAQTALDRAKVLEGNAAKALVAANALDKQKRAAGLTEKQRKELDRQADALRAQARAQAIAANASLEAARKAAADSLVLQKLAGDEAAKLFQEQFDAEAKADEEAAAFDKMTNAEKAAKRRADAEALKLKSEADLEKAKQLAYTDLEAANDLAQLAIQEADQARAFLDEALSYEQGGSSAGGGGPLGTVVNLEPTDAAALAFNDYSELVSAASVAAAGSRTVEFKQYNTSPDALSPSEVYRHTNNQLAFAIDKLDSDAA